MNKEFWAMIRKKLQYGQNPLIFLNLIIFIYGLGIYSAKNSFWHCKYPFFILIITIVISLILIWYKKWYGCLSLLIFIFILGNVRGDAYFNLTNNNIAHYINQEIALTGTIAEEPRCKINGEDVKITYIVDNLKLLNTAQPLTGKIYLHTKLHNGETIGKIGDGAKFQGKVKRITSYHNPGLIDATLNAKTQGIYARLLAYGEPVTIQSNSSFNLTRQTVELRQTLLAKFIKYLPEDNAHILYAMLFGGYTGIKQDILEAYTATGIVHILSVSGSHISLLAGFIMLLGNFLRFPPWLKLILLTLIVFLYAMLCGFVPPVIRASIMGILTVFAMTINRERDGKHLLSLTALLILLFNPLLLFNISFQLSFAATAGLIYLMPFLNKYFSKFMPKLLAAGLALTISAQIATAPLLAWYFNTISLSSLLANILVVPILEFIILLGLNASLLFLCLPKLASYLLLINNKLLDLANYAIIKISLIPMGNIFLPTMKLTVVLLYYFLIFLLLQKNFSTIVMKFIRKYTFYVLLIIFTATAYSIYLHHLPKPLNIHFIDVGQGDAALIITPHKHAVLIDTGGIRQLPGQNKEQSFDLGKRVLVPYLRHYGITKVDYLILSHAHMDHIGGAAGLIEKIPIQQLIISAEDKQLYAQGLGIKQDNPLLTQAIIATSPQEFTLDGVHFAILYPENDGKKRQGNDASNVIKLTYGKFTALFTGDLEAPGEEDLIRNATNLHALLLKVGHHGSDTSSTKDFIRAVAPSYAVISCGVDNSFGHPKATTLQTMAESNIKLYRTDQLGAINFSSDGKKLKINSYFSPQNISPYQ